MSAPEHQLQVTLSGDARRTRHAQGTQGLQLRVRGRLPAQLTFCLPHLCCHFALLPAPAHGSFCHCTPPCLGTRFPSAWNALPLLGTNYPSQPGRSLPPCANTVPCTQFCHRNNYLSITCLPACLSHWSENSLRRAHGMLFFFCLLLPCPMPDQDQDQWEAT